MSDRSLCFQVAKLIAETDSIAEGYLYYAQRTDDYYAALFTEEPGYEALAATIISLVSGSDSEQNLNL